MLQGLDSIRVFFSQPKKKKEAFNDLKYLISPQKNFLLYKPVIVCDDLTQTNIKGQALWPLFYQILIITNLSDLTD